jgi:CRISPR-associated protein Cas2
MIYIVSYDIEDDRVRSRLARYLEGRGVRIQKSVFVLNMERHELKRFLGEVKRMVKDTGDVAVFPQCTGCKSRAVRLRPCENRFYVL